MVIIVYDGERLSSNWRLMSVHLVTDQLIVTDHSVHCGYLLIYWVIRNRMYNVCTHMHDIVSKINNHAKKI